MVYDYAYIDRLLASNDGSLHFVKLEKTEGGVLTGPGPKQSSKIKEGLDDVKEAFQVATRPSTALVASSSGEPTIPSLDLILLYDALNREVDSYFQQHTNNEIHFKKVSYFGYVFKDKYVNERESEWENVKILQIWEPADCCVMVVTVGLVNYYEAYKAEEGSIVSAYSEAAYANTTRKID